MRKKAFWKWAVILCVLAVQCCFVSRKEGYHMDELLSFELSNAEFNPWIIPTQPVGRLAKFVKEEIRGESFGETMSNLVAEVKDVIENRGQSKMLQYKADVYTEPVWIDAKQFTDYLTAGKEDRFNYLSVYFNVKDDNHPPLHFMLLHTMSSLFPGRVAPYLGCAINMLAVLGCILCFFRLGELFAEQGFLSAEAGTFFSCLAGLLYGLSQGGVATVLLIRMYGMVTFFCVALFTIHVKKWFEAGFEKKNKLLGTVTALGFLTQYFFLFYCLALAAVTAGGLLVKKRYRELVSYIRCMAFAGAAGVALFPFAIADVLSSERGVEALGNLGSGFAGLHTRLSAFGQILLQRLFGHPAVGLVILICLVVAVVLLLYRGKKEETSLWLMLVVPFACYFLFAARMSPYLVDRYIMPLFPFAALICALVLAKLFQESFWRGARRKSRYLLALPALILCVANLCFYDGSYLYQGYERQLEVARQHQDLPCVCIYEGTRYYYNLMEFTWYEKTLLTTLPQLEERQDVEELAAFQSLVILKKSNFTREEFDRMLARYGWEVEQVLLLPKESVYGDTIYLVRKSSQGRL